MKSLKMLIAFIMLTGAVVKAADDKKPDKSVLGKRKDAAPSSVGLSRPLKMPTLQATQESVSRFMVLQALAGSSSSQLPTQAVVQMSSPALSAPPAPVVPAPSPSIRERLVALAAMPSSLLPQAPAVIPAPQSFGCAICSKDFDTEESQREHQDKCAEKDLAPAKKKSKKSTKDVYKKHVCPKPGCGKAFERPSGLKKHTRVHSGEKPFGCQHCPKRFSQKPHLKVHERNHTGEKPFGCKYCPKTFKQSSHKQSHERQHTLEEPYECPNCPAKFKASSGLKKHKDDNKCADYKEKYSEYFKELEVL
jgi:uncharacterized Zn-finger protein